MNEPADDIEALLPWYAAGALDPAEQARVEAALKARPELAANLAAAQGERDETVALNEALGAPGGDVWARIAQGVAAAPRRRPLSERLGAWLGFDGPTPRWAAYAATAAAVLLVAQGVTISALLRPGASAPGYQTVTQASAGADLLVMFAPQASVGEVNALLNQAGATIAGGPKAGFYEIRLRKQPATAQEIEQAKAAFQSAPKVAATVLLGGGK